MCKDMDEATNTSKRSPAAVKVLLLLTLSPAAAGKVIAKRNIKRGRRLHANQVGGAAPFLCRTCGRRFATFQALGGHRTSHKRPRVRADGLNLLLGTRPAGKTGAAVRSAAPVAVMHRCVNCGRAFPTGQALGGHMRRHKPVRAVMAPTGTSSSPLPSQSGGSTGQTDDNEWPTLFQFI